MALQYQIIPVTPFEQNCTLLWCDETMEGTLVDAGGIQQNCSLLLPKQV
jgi:hydroxyacylglutathione hydrolase